MSKKLKIVAELGCENNKSLLVELPKEVIEGLNIGTDGTVDTQIMLEIIKRYYVDAVNDDIDWMNMIFV